MFGWIHNTHGCIKSYKNFGASDGNIRPSQGKKSTTTISYHFAIQDAKQHTHIYFCEKSENFKIASGRFFHASHSHISESAYKTFCRRKKREKKCPEKYTRNKFNSRKQSRREKKVASMKTILSNRKFNIIKTHTASITSQY